jgi:hypothetical protein
MEDDLSSQFQLFRQVLVERLAGKKLNACTAAPDLGTRNFSTS